MDGIITGVESAVHKKYRPYGHVHMATRAHRGELNSGDWLDVQCSMFNIIMFTNICEK